MNPRDLSKTNGQPSPAENSAPTVIPGENEINRLQQNGHAPGHDTQILRAENRTQQAEQRAQQAEARTEESKTRTEQAETRTEQAEHRTEQAKARTEQAEARSERAESRSEQAILASELGYRRLFEAAREGIVIMEAATGRISDVNPFLVEMLGFSHDEWTGKPIWEIGSFKDIVANKAKFDQLREQGYVLDENLSLETKDSRKIAVSFVSNVYLAGDRQVIQCNVRDITDRKRLEEQIRGLNADLEKRVAERTTELDFANEELKAFSYSVSHDLQAPLRHIQGFITLLQKDAAPNLAEKDLRHLKIIFDAAKKMGQLIEDLLAFSRLGQSEMRKTTIALAELARETVADFQNQTVDRKITWEIQPLPTVEADRSLLHLVLVNLISNAVKFTGKRVEAKIEIGCAPGSGTETVIFIRDNGAGFDPEYAANLFAVFQRLHGQDEFAGTGIGLANVQRIIQRHGGRVWAEGAVEQGATFYFSLPIQPTSK